MKRAILPNGLSIFENNPGETAAAYSEIFEDRLYAMHGLTVVDDSCIFDIGAHIGMATLFFHRQASRVRIYAFEPSPVTFEVLSANVELHGVNARLFNVALSSSAGEATYTFYPNCPGMSGLHASYEDESALAKAFLVNKGVDAEDVDFLVKDRFAATPMRVPLRTVSDVIAEQGVERIDLLKLDVEKSEAEVLSGIHGQDWDKIQQFVAEVHDVEGRLSEMTRMLAERGFTVTPDQDPTVSGTNFFTLYATRR